MLHKCKEHGRRLCWSCFTFTFGFYAEHYIGQHVFPFYLLSRLLGLT